MIDSISEFIGLYGYLDAIRNSYGQVASNSKISWNDAQNVLTKTHYPFAANAGPGLFNSLMPMFDTKKKGKMSFLKFVQMALYIGGLMNKLNW